MKRSNIAIISAAVFSLLCILLICACPASADPDDEDIEYGPTPAFPGAQGHGRYTTGGRGGLVYYVTNLEDYGNREDPIPGSLRYGIERFGIEDGVRTPTTIVFNIAGTIILKRELRISRGNLTIAGQSAPGGGITIGGFSVNLSNADNVIIRFIRFRMGDLFDVNADGADALWGRRGANIIIDHCSMSWSTDECVSFYGNRNFTMQWCIISESLNESLHSKGAHGYGGIWGGMKASFLNNLVVHHNSRVPRLGPDPANSTLENELTDMRNNVFFNYNGLGAYGGEGMNVNIVNNFYNPGPAASASPGSDRWGRIMSIDKSTDSPNTAYFNQWGTFFIDGNVVQGHLDATADNWTHGVYNQFHHSYGTVSQEDKDAMRVFEPLDTGYVITRTAEKAFDSVVSWAGASLNRDSIDERIILETFMNTTTFRGSISGRAGLIDSVMDLKPAGAGEDWLPWPALDPGTPITDTTGDGIPDGWLEANHPGNTANCLNPEGFTYLEVYLNSIVDHIIRNR